jgi:folate-dependent phosphoribosylglycinamide formyltransferase PurN
MRILLCSKRDLTSVVILNDLLARLRRIPDCVVYLMLAERTRKVETVVPELIHMKVFERDLPFAVLFPLIEGRKIGSQESAAAIDEAISRYDLPLDGFRRRPIAPAERLLTLNRLVERHRVPFQIVHRIEDNNLRVTAGAFQPDLILSVRFSFIFPRPFIALPRLGVINVHPGAVPGYAGLYPHFHSMLAGGKTLGCTVHFVDDGIDSGAVLATGEVPIDPARSAFSHNLASHLVGNRLVAEIVEALAAGRRLRGTLQDRSRLRQHTYPTPEEFAAFEMKGLSLIDMTEYLDLLGRFGLFAQMPAPAVDRGLPESRDSDRISTTYRG